MQLGSTAEVITPLQIYSIPTEACVWSNSKICRTFILSQISTYLEWAKEISFIQRVIFDNKIKTSDAKFYL